MLILRYHILANLPRDQTRPRHAPSTVRSRRARVIADSKWIDPSSGWALNILHFSPTTTAKVPPVCLCLPSRYFAAAVAPMSYPANSNVAVEMVPPIRFDSPSKLAQSKPVSELPSSPQTKLLRQLDVLLDKEKTWTTPLCFNTAPPEAEEACRADLVKCLQDGKPHLLPEHFHGLEDQHRVVMDLKIACLQTGCKVHCKTRKEHAVDPSRTAGRTNRKLCDLSIHMVCDHQR